MESDSWDEPAFKKGQRESGFNLFSNCNFFKPSRVRRRILFRNAMDRILLGYNLYILPVISLFLWLIFLATKKG
jgi:hypothetical protein